MKKEDINEKTKNKKGDWINALLLGIVILFAIFKTWRIIQTTSGYSLADELDFTNPSPIGILATLCLIIYFV